MSRHSRRVDEHYSMRLFEDFVRNSFLFRKIQVFFLSKSIVTYDVVEKLIKKDWVDPISGDKITEEDIIELQRGGGISCFIIYPFFKVGFHKSTLKRDLGFRISPLAFLFG